MCTETKIGVGSKVKLTNGAGAPKPASKKPKKIGVGSKVKLTKDYQQYGDASGGPLKRGEIGEVVLDDDSSMPFRVRAPNGCEWWYKAKAIELVPETPAPLDPEEAGRMERDSPPPDGESYTIQIQGAGGERGTQCNGTYTQSGTHNGKPLYVQNGGAAKIYYNKYWKISRDGSTGGWCYGVDTAVGPYPPTQWRDDGYDCKKNRPFPTLKFVCLSEAERTTRLLGICSKCFDVRTRKCKTTETFMTIIELQKQAREGLGSAQPTELPVCGDCDNKAKQRCSTCQIPLCDKCCEDHRRRKTTKDHPLEIIPGIIQRSRLTEEDKQDRLRAVDLIIQTNASVPDYSWRVEGSLRAAKYEIPGSGAISSAVKHWVQNANRTRHVQLLEVGTAVMAKFQRKRDGSDRTMKPAIVRGVSMRSGKIQYKCEFVGYEGHTYRIECEDVIPRGEDAHGGGR